MARTTDPAVAAATETAITTTRNRRRVGSRAAMFTWPSSTAALGDATGIDVIPGKTLRRPADRVGRWAGDEERVDRRRPCAVSAGRARPARARRLPRDRRGDRRRRAAF